MLKNRKAATGFIFITVLLDVIGFGIIIPVFPKLITHLTHSNMSTVSQWGGLLSFAYAIMQFVFAPILGNLSDQYGRRRVLLFSLLGFGIDYIFMAFAPTIGWLFLGRIFSGAAGSSITTASAYMADISTEKNRAQNFGMIGAAFGIGFIIGPVMGGILGQYGTRIPFIVSACVALLNALYGYFVLPESLTKEHRRKFQWKRANPVGSLKQLRKYPSIGGLLGSLLLVYIASHAVQSTWVYFNMEKFNWSESLIGYSLGMVGLLVAIVQGGLIRFINPRLGNEKSVYIGLGLYSLGLLLFAFASQTWMMFVFLIPYCLGGIAGPALQSIISGNVPRNEQGELQGALTSLISVTTIIGPVVMTFLFSFFTKPNARIHFPGAPFLLGAILMLGSALIAFYTLRERRVAKENVVSNE